MSYEVLEKDHEDNVIEYTIRQAGAVKSAWYEKLLSAAYAKATSAYRTGISR